MAIGQIDEPLRTVRDDRLSLDLQVEGFSSFVLNCETPMTIGIQGRWGSGKTSFVNMVEADIRRRLGEQADTVCPFITFNAWKFAQFNMDTKLTVSMLSALTQEMAKGMPEGKNREDSPVHKVLSCVSKLGKLAAYSLNDYVENKSGIDVAGRTKLIFAQDENADNDMVSDILTLQKNFTECVKQRLGIVENNPEHRRLVIFVDDLDRLAPDKAIEILEILKLFLDCRDCVFILAIDYSVVVNGVSIKYKNTLSAQKGEDFFEKMIQVVYTMPESALHTERLIASSLRENKCNISVAPDFAELIKSAGKNNPRSIKRILNSYYLLSEIQKQNSRQPDYECQEHAIALFATMCLQIENQGLYNYLQANSEKITPELLDAINCFTWGNTDGRDIFPEDPRFLQISELDGRTDSSHIPFLKVFMRQLYFSGIERDCIAFFDGEVHFTEEHAQNLCHCLELTELSNIHTHIFTDYDAVSSVLIGESELCPTLTGTIDEAFSITVRNMVPSSTRVMLDSLVYSMDRVFSLDSGHFEESGRIDLHTPFRVGEQLMGILVPPECNGNCLYYDRTLTADQKVDALMLLAERLEYPFTWFSDRTLQNILIEYPGKACFPHNPAYSFTTHPEEKPILGNIFEAPDFDRIPDLAEKSLQEIMDLTGYDREKAQNLLNVKVDIPFGWDDISDLLSDNMDF